MAIAKRFPKGYIVHDQALHRFRTPCECWLVVDHLGKTSDGLEYFICAGRNYPHPTMQEAISQLQELRDTGVVT